MNEPTLFVDLSRLSDDLLRALRDTGAAVNGQAKIDAEIESRKVTRAAIILSEWGSVFIVRNLRKTPEQWEAEAYMPIGPTMQLSGMIESVGAWSFDATVIPVTTALLPEAS